MNGAPRILIIDDNPVDRDRMIGELRRELPDLSLRHVARESECVEALAAGDFDLVLTEHHLPWTDGLSILRTVKARFPGCPVLVVTGSENEAFAVRDISAGLDGYVLKTPQDLARLPHAVRAAWEHARRQRELEAAAAQCRDLLDRVPVGPYRATQEGKFLDANRFLFESHPHPMWVYDLDSLAFLAVNAAAVRHYGYAREEFLALTIRDIRPPEDIPALLANVAQVTAGLDAAGTWRHRKKDGTIIDVEITSHAILFEGRRAEVVLAYDITDRRRAEEALARRTAQWETIRTATEEIIRELDLATVMGIITRRALELVDGTSGGVALWDESAQLLVPRSWRGQAGVSEQVRWRLGEGVAGTVAQRREGMIVNEYRTSPYAHPLLLAQTGFTAVIAAPLVYRDRLLGVISIDNEGSGRRFTEDDRTILALFAAQAAVAIENARLFGEISRAKGEWENTFDAAADLIAVVDPEYRLVRANRALAQKFRTTPQAVIGRRCYEIFEGFVTPPPECPLAECLRTG
ncbi:MAG TPA: GAF domain-containing protein, partial [Candidatus Acidoferrum sp.]|nr:GAF domain-containing protein [Candidatus Acidoferrum sp.]